MQLEETDIFLKKISKTNSKGAPKKVENIVKNDMINYLQNLYPQYSLPFL